MPCLTQCYVERLTPPPSCQNLKKKRQKPQDTSSHLSPFFILALTSSPNACFGFHCCHCRSNLGRMLARWNVNVVRAASCFAQQQTRCMAVKSGRANWDGPLPKDYPVKIKTIGCLTRDQVLKVLELALAMKADPQKYSAALKSKTLLMLFEKPSLRTRVSFETGMTQLGGHAIYYNIADSPLGKKESIQVGDHARVFCTILSCFDAEQVRRKISTCQDTRGFVSPHAMSTPASCPTLHRASNRSVGCAASLSSLGGTRFIQPLSAQLVTSRTDNG